MTEQFNGWFKDHWKNVTAAVLTGGASIAADKELREDVGEVFKRVGRELEDAFDGPWEAFENVIRKNIKAFQPPFSVSKVLMAVKAIALGGGSVLADGGLAALNEFIFSKLAPYMRQIADAMGGCIGEGRDVVTRNVEHELRDHTHNKVFARILKEIVGAVYDIVTGYPPCTCEEGCISPVSKGLKDAGGVPGLIGTILWYLWPIMQGRPSKDVPMPKWSAGASPCLYWYGNNGMFLVNAQLGESTTKALGKVMKYIDSDTGKNFVEGMPKSFDAYRPYLVDLVARGYDGPTVMGGTGRNARWYFNHPDEARKVISDSNLIERQIHKVTEAIDKYVGWLDEAYKIGKVAFDLYESWGADTFDFSSIDANDVMRMAKNFLGKDARNLVEAPMKRYAREIAEKLDMGEVVGAYAKLYDAAKKVQDVRRKKKRAAELPKLLPGATAQGAAAIKNRIATTPSVLANVLKSGNIAGLNELEDRGALNSFGVSTGQAFMGEWQAAQIGLEARQRWNHMVFLWANMTDAERSAMRLDTARNERMWGDTGINYNGSAGPLCGPGDKSWYHLLTTDKRAKDAVYNIQFPHLFVEWLATAEAALRSASHETRERWRKGEHGDIPNPGKWSFRIPQNLIPSPKDVGFPTTASRAAGIDVWPEQYILWINDMLNVYDPNRWRKAGEEMLGRWGIAGSTEAKKWLNDPPSATNPPVVLRKVLVDEINTTTNTIKLPGIPFKGGQLGGQVFEMVLPTVTYDYVTYKALWAGIFNAAKIAPGFNLAKLSSTAKLASWALDSPISKISQEVLAAAKGSTEKVATIVAEKEVAAVVAAAQKSPSNWAWWAAAGIIVAGGLGAIAYSKR